MLVAMSTATCLSLSKLAITSVLFLPLLARAAPSPCETLAKFVLPDTFITLAQSVPAGEFTPPEGFRPEPGDPPASALAAARQSTSPVLPRRGHSEAHPRFRH